MKQATLDLIKNIDENTFIPPSTKNELFELFQLDTVADLRKVSRNFMKLYEILEHLDSQTSSATTEKAGIVKFGTETGNAIDAETWKQAIGQSLGGYVSKVESKEAGKWYINDLTDGKIYKCIQTHTSTSFDITKFVDITNVGLSDKVENLSENWQLVFHGLLFSFSRNNFIIPISKKCKKLKVISSIGIDDPNLHWVTYEYDIKKTNYTLVAGENDLNYFYEDNSCYYFKISKNTALDDNYAYIYAR